MKVLELKTYHYIPELIRKVSEKDTSHVPVSQRIGVFGEGPRRIAPNISAIPPPVYPGCQRFFTARNEDNNGC